VPDAGSILVTGAGGFAGSHLLTRLLRDAARVEGWHHPSGAAPSRASAPAERGSLRWRAVDLVDADAVERAIADLRPSRVYHLAGAADQGKSWERSTEALHINAFGAHLLLAALARLDTPCRVVVTTSAAVYAPSTAPLTEDSPIGPTSPYGVSKVAQELVARHANATTAVDVIVCRPFNHIGPGQGPGFAAANFAKQVATIARGEAPPVIRVGNLTAHRDLTDVRDTVRAYERLMADGRPGEIYNVCRGEAYAMRAVLDRLVSESGVDVSIEVAPELLRPVDQPVLVGSYARLHDATGWAPEIPLDQTLRDLLDWWRG
jgi:GDP-4-dehydro-6-deoxy-D-mannose reductase